MANFKWPMWHHWTQSWEVCTISLCTGELFLEHHCLQDTLASHKRPSVPISTAPSSGPCLTFPFSHNELLVAPPIHHVFSCYIILFMLFPLTAIPSPPSSFPNSSSTWLQFILQGSVQAEAFSSGKLALKSYEPGDSSRTRGQSVTHFSPCKRNGKNQTTFVHISKSEYNYQM